MLPFLRVIRSRRVKDCDQHLHEVMVRITQRVTPRLCYTFHADPRPEKAVHLIHHYLEFPARSFVFHGAYVEHILARQQTIHDSVRRNTHQEQQRQKLKYDRAIREITNNVRDPVWVFCHYVPQKG